MNLRVFYLTRRGLSDGYFSVATKSENPHIKMAACLIKIGKRPFLYGDSYGSILVVIARLLHSVRTILRNLFIFRADR